MRPLVLASTSASRRALLESAGIPARSEAPGVDERAFSDPDPVRLVRTLALAKANAVAERFPGALVLGADQVAVHPERPDEPFGKPESEERHFEMLAGMRGRTHVLVTGFALVTSGADDEVGHEQTTLRVRSDLTDEELWAYVRSGEGRGCAGGYRAEGRGAFLFEAIEGDWFNVLGLPVLRVLDALRRRGWRFGT
jgi:septum formation protein